MERKNKYLERSLINMLTLITILKLQISEKY